MSGILIQVLQFFASLSLLVLIHEFGHYITARMFGIRVEKFYLFFNPWFTLYKRQIGNTEYGIGWLPMGGYVSLAGMIDESMNVDQMKEEPKPWEFRTKPAWQRLIVMLAGIIMNIILAIVIYSGILYTWGTSYIHNDDVVNGYIFNERAEGLGFVDGDRIVAIDGEGIENIMEIREKLIIADDDRTVTVARGKENIDITLPLSELVATRESGEFRDFCMVFLPFEIKTVDTDSAAAAGLQSGDKVLSIAGEPVVDFVHGKEMLQAYANQSIAIEVERNGEVLELNVPISEDARMGVSVKMIEPRTREYGFWESIPAGAAFTWDKVVSYWDQLKMIVNPETKGYKELGGFIAIGSIFPKEWSWQSFWSLTAFISVVLAIMNLLPIPGLDGGHALVTIWEIVTRRKPSDKFLEILQYIGLGFLILLMLYANGSDIVRLFN